MKYSTTGINHLNREFPIEAIIFESNICPHCGNELRIDTLTLQGNKIRNRFVCPICDFVCPIRYIDGKIIPIYDKSIYEFINSFGEHIEDRRSRLPYIRKSSKF